MLYGWLWPPCEGNPVPLPGAAALRLPGGVGRSATSAFPWKAHFARSLPFTLGTSPVLSAASGEGQRWRCPSSSSLRRRERCGAECGRRGRGSAAPPFPPSSFHRPGSPLAPSLHPSVHPSLRRWRGWEAPGAARKGPAGRGLPPAAAEGARGWAEKRGCWRRQGRCA